MAIRIVEICPASSGKALNTEWFIVENTGDKPFSFNKCSLGISRGGQRPRSIGIIEPGFVLAPGAKYRVVTGRPGKKAYGVAPKDDIPNYHLFLGTTYLKTLGTVISVSLRTAEVARATFDPNEEGGVRQSERSQQ